MKKKHGKRKPTGQKPKQADIVDLILRDHVPLKELIEKLKETTESRARRAFALEKFVPLLIAHAKSEEKCLYEKIKEIQELRVLGHEGDTEHEIADRLAQEINGTPDDAEWDAKLKVLAELVGKHIEDEENELLPKARELLSAEDREAIGLEYLHMHEEMEVLYRPRPARPKRYQEQLSH